MATTPAAAAGRSGVEARIVAPLEPVRHAFTHFELLIEPIRLRATPGVNGCRLHGSPPRRWYRGGGDDPPTALPAPVARLLERSPGRPAGG